MKKRQVKTRFIRVQKQEKTLQDILDIKCQNEVTSFKLRELVFCQAAGSYTTYFLKDKTSVISGYRLSKSEARLSNDFFRTHHSFVVNRNYVEGIYTINRQSYAVMKNNIMIPVAKRKIAKFRKFLNPKTENTPPVKQNYTSYETDGEKFGSNKPEI